MTTSSNAIQLILVEEIGSSPNDWAWKFYFPSSAESSKTFSIDFDCSTPWELFIESLEPAFMTVGDVGHFRDMCYSVCDSIYMELVFPNGAAPLIEHDVLYQLLEVARRFEYITCTNLYFNVSADSFYQPREIEVIAQHKLRGFCPSFFYIFYKFLCLHNFQLTIISFLCYTKNVHKKRE